MELIFVVLFTILARVSLTKSANEAEAVLDKYNKLMNQAEGGDQASEKIIRVFDGEPTEEEESKRAVSMLRMGRSSANFDEDEYALMPGRRSVSFLRMGKKLPGFYVGPEGDSGEEVHSNEKKAVSLLRMGRKRSLDMLRMGR